jgi:putative membrane protein insertion efficiency factor
VRYLGTAIVWAYRGALSVIPGAGACSCKYHPSCSQYALDAYKEFGLFKGSVLAAWRLLRCNPWSRGGVDYARDQQVFT